MATFSYNPNSNESRFSQYGRFLQNQNYVNKIDKSIRETGSITTRVIEIQSKEIQKIIQESSQSQRDAIIQTRDSICSSLESGFSYLYEDLGDIKDGIRDINSNLEDIYDSINGLTNIVGHGFSLVLEGHKITHKYLGKVVELLRIPQSQLERAYNIDKGMEFINSAFMESSDSEFYTNALKKFETALSYEETDFLSLYYIGFIYLKSNKYLDPMKAERYFLESARYYLSHAQYGGSNIASVLLTVNDCILEAAKAYLFAAESCYIQEKFSEAILLAEKAWMTFPEMTKARFAQAKYSAANNQISEAAKILEEVLRNKPSLSMEVFSDRDLISKPKISQLMEMLKVEAVQEAKANYELCRKVIIPNSIASSYLADIDKLIKLGTFLDAKKANDMILFPKNLG
ncbi:MAG: hypothetical protein HYZ54_01050 [Ignavibacteriae bacterium]|nr:hypothetical protein [Ignavibacteriota bacterium]